MNSRADWESHRHLFESRDDFEVAEIMGVSEPQAAIWRKRFGFPLKRRFKKKWSEAFKVSGDRYEIARMMGASMSHVEDAARVRGLNLRPLVVCVCGNAFRQIRPNHVYCSPECHTIGNGLKKDNPYYVNAMMDMRRVWFALVILANAVEYRSRRRNKLWLVQKVDFLCSLLGERWESAETSN